MVSPESPLAGRNILVTRPAHQAQHFCEFIKQAGGQPVLFPVMDIVALDESAALCGIMERLDEFAIALFVSPNAVNIALNWLHARQRRLPAHVQLGAVGRKSAQALERFGYMVSICPPGGFDSEALLALDALQAVAGKQVVIFRGEGGRELMAQTLTARGATVTFAEIYKRVSPDVDMAPLRQRWSRGEVNLVTITSAEGLRNLYEMLDPLMRTWLASTDMLVGHERIAAVALQLGMKKHPWVAADPSDESMFAALLQWAQQA
ncbi:uroporphyrinogen-III synthase [Thiorhodospira sibirica]|uniref:uroporphyrinogen-III synthase n=1 Tax=Thiorhodospira sibirica TaxID=154347 RepID=UPI00022C4C4F|nr:uroporphyrinogen-III synthase [Thiorhodospira sibirica]